MRVSSSSANKKLKRAFVWVAFVLLLEQLSTDAQAQKSADLCKTYPCQYGGVVSGDTSEKRLALVFTGDEFADGGEYIREVLKTLQVKTAFFFTGTFYRNSSFQTLIADLRRDGHYLGAHSDRHLLYCPWENRDSLLVTKAEFLTDLAANYDEMARFGIKKEEAPYFLPPYEWYNDSISRWTKDFGLQLINYSAGTRSTADYTTPDMPNYRSSEVIYESIISYEQKSDKGLNGFILLIHIGTDSKRTDKFYLRLEELIVELRGKGYQFVAIEKLLK